MGFTTNAGHIATSSSTTDWNNTQTIFYPINSTPVDSIQFIPKVWTTTTGNITIVPPSLRSKDFSSFKKRALKLYKDRYTNGEDTKI